MKLIKQPETQLEYWVVLEELGHIVCAFIDPRIPDPNLASDFIEKDNFELYETSLIINQMLIEIGDKFGITRPYGDTKPIISPNQTYYWDWYGNMKNEFYKKNV